jgi:hypothetical protein
MGINDGGWQMSSPLETGKTISTFGEGEDGRLYLADWGSGMIWEITD